MDLRKLQARIEEVKLEGMYAELRALDNREVEMIEQKVQAEKELHAKKSVMGEDLALFASYKEAAQDEQKRMDKARHECRAKIATQLAVVTVRRRNVKLLERLKEQRFETWEKEMFKEIDQQAEEAYIAKWCSR